MTEDRKPPKVAVAERERPGEPEATITGTPMAGKGAAGGSGMTGGAGATGTGAGTGTGVPVPPDLETEKP
jgi:hypothetical protein